MSRELKTYLAISWGWAALVGLGLSAAGVPLGSIRGIAVIAVLYMPSPFVAAVIAERGIVKNRFRMPRGRAMPVLVFLLAPVITVLVFVFLFLAAVLVGGDLMDVPAFGSLATTPAQIMAGAARLFGQEAVDAAGPPPPVIVLLLASIGGALLAGWTINGLFALGEEYGWRGLMWEELRDHGVVPANLAIGVAWGLWHAPVVVQGYNYPGHPLLGVLAMVMFCTGLSFVLTALRELTESVLPVAAAHGIFNALAPILLILAPGTHLVITGPLGLLGALLLLLIGGSLWAVALRQPSTVTADT